MSAHTCTGRPGDRPAFWKIAGSGATFQAGSSAVDSATVIASLVHHLTGSFYAVGAASAILRIGWLAPQIVVGHLAQRSRRRMPFYAAGAFGRAGCIGAIAILLATGSVLPVEWVGAGFFLLWVAYSFVSGIVAVPYNDIVGRTIESRSRSRLLAWRFFGGGLLALGVAAVGDQLLNAAPVLTAYAGILALGAGLMIISSASFVSVREPAPPAADDDPAETFGRFIASGLSVLRSDRRFRLFVYGQWLAGATVMALPFYVIAALGAGLTTADVGLLLAAQTAGALVSNPLWGLIGDRIGKLALLQSVGLVRMVVPAAALAVVSSSGGLSEPDLVAAFVAIFVAVGVLSTGMTIGYLGYLLEISPDQRRPAYTAYFNAFASPAALLPLAGALIADAASLEAVFALALAASAILVGVYRILAVWEPSEARP